MFENNESPSQGLTQLSQSSKHTVEEDFLTLTPRTTIQGLKDCKEFGTIKHILGDDDWWYTACVCNKDVYPDSKMFFLREVDATILFKKTCADMLDTHDKINASGNLPKKFDQLVDKSLLFKVESRNDQTFKLEQSFRMKKFGTIKHILGDDDWWYTACVCNKDVYPDSKMFFLREVDATILFKKTCADMLDTHDKINASGNLPKKFDQLVDKSLLFKVESRNDQTFKLEQSFRMKKRVVNESTVDIVEAVGFVDRAFAILYDHDLERQWTLTDVEGNKHVDTYNKNLQKPMLIGRWTDLRNLYQLHDNHTIYFGYVGHSCFQITVFPSKCKPLSIGRFLKRLEVDEPLFNGPKLHFFIFLNPNQCHASHLDLPADFGNYLRQGRFKNIFLYGPRKIGKCKLLLRNHPKKSNKIISG
ncbi:hypothetical protein DEO72_LG6g1398 [Vigna unguiculata]|uniref:Nucleic acid-binding n=1 Tax=Vigna unguiculata TaxID=3917 RepID=A0A4D6M7P0_VIGUN|nr:hypothetical protein DEO72_LG6g1398 [Vigna unguiculata]